ncbi:mannose-1-phosphate guanylyltransferase/mannose-6-phosphate isomerase [Acidithiobacillus sp. HP-6]|uniref:mannose-1-phosphate guanylyltransferase/mannose-6-phosphate isomerase n=1 Tax=unclassified Acidithiobacillus TaxID=2614800 RepID=UPI001879D160|nr:MULTISPECIES: mannose-1-phosphate guanylyltransferase/mannose-6-phosphate isomerase [unclassified Acidithiobacillus]MBE7564240.1 mannose-1-phosphate guanylyltransferase/mannose-6-phosphate isomerase [Acidithiobacillus sp. HP-6]MBE7570909.1 mannose-1-phosphate guanylyltransferase/mannose-6-phosphate isomerase [Acidithiobacillus sp. HP-2]
MALVPVILSGGTGSRLWPLSRKAFPKPFVALPDGESLIQKTLRRVIDIKADAPLLTVTNRDYYFMTRDTFAECARMQGQTVRNVHYLLEPAGRNTTPAMAAAALWAQEVAGPESILLVLPSDHLIHDHKAFAEAVHKAQQLAEQGYLVTFGVTPTGPETGYGYIQKGTALDSGYQVARFVEKPNQSKARDYLDSGDYLWNSGMFCMRADSLLNALQTDAPEVLEAVQAAIVSATRNGDTWELGQEFALAPDISIDYAVMEKAPNVAVVQADFDWNDLGAWSGYGSLMAKDAQGNQVHAPDCVLVDSQNCVVQSPDRLTAILGLQDILIVDTPDALLVADRRRDQEVKTIVEKLKARKHSTVDLHATVHRPWGTYTTLEEGDHFKIKRIVVKKGEKLSLQMHHHRSEHWIVVSGTARIVNGQEEKLIMTNQSTYIPAGCQHRLENPGMMDLVLIEVQSGAYLGEDDIVRFDDIYGRTEAASTTV